MYKHNCRVCYFLIPIFGQRKEEIGQKLTESYVHLTSRKSSSVILKKASPNAATMPAHDIRTWPASGLYLKDSINQYHTIKAEL